MNAARLAAEDAFSGAAAVEPVASSPPQVTFRKKRQLEPTDASVTHPSSGSSDTPPARSPRVFRAEAPVLSDAEANPGSDGSAGSGSSADLQAPASRSPRRRAAHKRPSAVVHLVLPSAAADSAVPTAGSGRVQADASGNGDPLLQPIARPVDAGRTAASRPASLDELQAGSRRWQSIAESLARLESTLAEVERLQAFRRDMTEDESPTSARKVRKAGPAPDRK